MANFNKKQFCIRNHDTFICGRWKNGSCKECTKEKRRKYELGKRPKKQFCINGHDLSIVGEEINLENVKNVLN